jgi:uncharacterized surface protein with fasciclin (FAS1) repeats
MKRNLLPEIVRNVTGKKMKALLVFLMVMLAGMTKAQTTVMDIIAHSADHTILETAIIEAELEDALRGHDPLTVFAPTDDAFAALPDGALDALLIEPTGVLADILLYHVVAGETLSSALSDGQVITTLNGQSVTVTISHGDVFINDAQVTVADQTADNGVVHVIDAVLIPSYTIWDVVAGSPVHHTLEAAVLAAGLEGALAGEGPLTLFAPTDNAFAALPDGLVDELLQDPTGELTQILLYHVVGDKALSTDLSDGQLITTLNGDSVTVTISHGEVFIDDARVLVADFETSNGVIHVIDAVLSPYSTVLDVIVGSPDHNILETAIFAAHLDGALSGEGPLTVFAPTDDAFTALPDGVLDELLQDPTGDLADILLYHVVDAKALSTDLSDGQMITTLNGDSVRVKIMNGDVYIDNAKVTLADIETDNGVVHVIDAVLIPTYTVWEVIVNSDDHNTLEAAIKAAGLDEALSGEGPLTVFAPTDDAFAALPDGVVDALLQDPAGDLTDILLYHVVGAKALSTDLSDGQMITTLNGDSVMVKIMDGNVYIDNAMVTVADIETDNGVVHVIDAVLIPTYTVWEVIVNSEDHNTLEAAIKAAGLDGALSGEGPLTVFAPTDDAFAALPDGVVDALLQDPSGDLTDILLYHVVGAKALSTDLSDGQMITTLNGDSVKVKIMDGNVYIDNAMVTVADIETDNGVVHVIDAVLIPTYTVWEVIVNSDDHNTLEAAIKAAGLDEALSGEGPLTVFAPTDNAFAALPDGVVDALLQDPSGDLTDILLYHVVAAKALSTDLADGQMITTLNGDSVMVKIMNGDVYIDDAMVTLADIETDNGVVHVIDAVLVPYSTVWDVIVGSADHNTLEAAVKAAGLDGALSGEGPLTVFAPTDDAFAALPDGVVDALLQDPSGDLTDILLYHVVGAKALSTDLSDGQMITTLNGDSVKVKIMDGNVYIDNAMVTVADIETDNGVVHVIDAVLIPTYTVWEVIVNSDDHNTLEAAIKAAGLDEALSGEGPLTVFAPTDDAFAALPDGVVDALLQDPAGDLTDILLYHVVAAKALSTDLSDGQMITTLNGDSVMVKIMDGNVYIDDAMVTVADIETDNGVVHVIDAVLVPYSTVWDVIVGSADHNTLEAAVKAAGLDGALSGEGPLTVFAPTDDAFAALPDGVVDALLQDPSGDLTDILLYHVVGAKALSTDLSDGQMITTLNGDSVKVKIMDGNVYIDNAMVTLADIETDNGVVHVIDAVLIPTYTVWEVIVNSDDHNTLEAAIKAAGLDEALSGEGPLTVFAPTDDAFAALPEGTVEALLQDPTGELTQILLYHVVAAKALSTDLSDGQMITTLQGSDITVSISDGDVFINDAKVILADIETDNGVVHVIDAVLIPTTTGIEDRIAAASEVNIYPNPAREFVNVRYDLVRESNVTIMMYDLTGQQVMYQDQGFSYQGNYSVQLPVFEMTPGLYILVINTDTGQVANKVKIVK